MFARVKKSGRNEYLQLVENRREGKKISQRVVATIGRMDELQAGGSIETIIRSLSRFSEKIMLILSARDNPDLRAAARKIGPTIIVSLFPVPTAIATSGAGIIALTALNLFPSITCIGPWPFWERIPRIRRIERRSALAAQRT